MLVQSERLGLAYGRHVGEPPCPSASAISPHVVENPHKESAEFCYTYGMREFLSSGAINQSGAQLVR